MKSIHPAQLYQLLHYTQNLEEKTVLDCGAGGRRPPLALFHEYGFKTTGIEISTSQIEASKEYEKKHNMDLNIIQGDMLDLNFPDESFTCVYSFNSSIHLSKKDTPAKQMYLGEERAPGECWMMGRNGEEVLHTLFSEEETDEIMKGHEILLKYKQELTMKLGDELLDDAYIHYYIRKK